MSLTAEQREKAEKAIRNKKIQDILKRHALERRNRCIKDVPFFGLPYRILFSLETPPDRVELSKFYPCRACRKETEGKIKAALQRERKQGGELSEERINEIQKQIESVDYTPENMRAYYFTPFLSGWDFSTFQDWDWTGNRVTKTEADRLRRYYTERQGLYEDHPERFAQPALKANDDTSRYSEKTKELLKLFDICRSNMAGKD